MYHQTHWFINDYDVGIFMHDIQLHRLRLSSGGRLCLGQQLDRLACRDPGPGCNLHPIQPRLATLNPRLQAGAGIVREQGGSDLIQPFPIQFDRHNCPESYLFAHDISCLSTAPPVVKYRSNSRPPW